MTSPSPGTLDPHNLQRFVIAQAPVFDWVLKELRAGRKRTHWMWFIFPQIAGLGRNSTAIHYAIKSHSEAEAYLAHAELGPRLRDAAQAAMTVGDRTANEIFGETDERKLRSCATLFDTIEPNTVFDRLLAHFFDGVRDTATIDVLDRLRDLHQ